jgi:translation initiation factor 4G
MTPEKFDKISDDILAIANQSVHETDGRTLRQVIQLTFEKACDEAHWGPMYARFCMRMQESMSKDIKDENIRDRNDEVILGGALFRKYLLNRCQDEFERGWEVNLPAKPEGQEEVALLSEEYYLAAAAKRRGLGLIQFIGELYKLGMLNIRIMHECVLKLLNFEGLPDEAAIESLVKLLRTIGKVMEETEKGPAMIQLYFDRIESIMNMQGLPSRMYFMLLDTRDLKEAGWDDKKGPKGPKTLGEIHQEAQAKQMADAERARSAARTGRPPMGGRGDTRSFSGSPSVPPPDYTRNTVGMDDLKKLSGRARQNQTTSGASLGPSGLLASGRTGSGRRGLGPTRADESGQSSRTGTPPVKESIVTKNAFE